VLTNISRPAGKRIVEFGHASPQDCARLRGVAATMRTVLAALSLFCLTSLAGAALAQAQAPAPAPADGFRICNKSGQELELATAIDPGDQDGASGTYLSKGWYTFEAGQCFVMWPGALQHRYYFIYAQNKQTGREWKGDVPVCVSRDSFELKSPSCGGDKYSRPFLRVDTGNSASWTYNLLP
jgi:uncharacterized membrane protein